MSNNSNGSSNEQLKTYTQTALTRLENVYEEVLKTQGYNANTEKLKLLCELLKEQINESIDPRSR
ncbi:MAG: hypothetical protein LW875_01425 [Proteobacteria bacterium]|jgi:hypothetical protein|nr:hypothetical protein [Pseudomonadota bacterium]